MNDPQYPQSQPLTDREAAAEAYRLIREAYQQDAPPAPATSFRDTAPVPAYGSALPVPQPDTRTVPQWAAGVAVASVGVGAGITGLGCGAWLVLQGLSSVTLLGVMAITAPFAGIAAVVTAIGAAVSKARSSSTSTTHVYEGTVIQQTEVTAHARGMLSRANAGR